MNEEIEREIKREERFHHIAGIIIIVILFLAVIHYTNPDRRGGYYPDEIDDPCIAYNC